MICQSLLSVGGAKLVLPLVALLFVSLQLLLQSQDGGVHLLTLLLDFHLRLQIKDAQNQVVTVETSLHPLRFMKPFRQPNTSNVSGPLQLLLNRHDMTSNKTSLLHVNPPEAGTRNVRITLKGFVLKCMFTCETVSML